MATVDDVLLGERDEKFLRGIKLHIIPGSLSDGLSPIVQTSTLVNDLVGFRQSPHEVANAGFWKLINVRCKAGIYRRMQTAAVAAGHHSTAIELQLPRHAPL